MRSFVMAEFEVRSAETCQWCGGTIPAGGDACESCGAARPRDDLDVSGLTAPELVPYADVQQAPAPVEPEESEEERRARQLLKDMDAYVSEEEVPKLTSRRDPGDDALMIIGILGMAAIVGGLVGWFIAPPLIHDLFVNTLGIESDGPEAFRRLGAFIGALLSMLMGAMFATVARR